MTRGTPERRVRKRRPHPALSARILATGLSVSAMLGLTTAMTAQAASEEAQDEAERQAAEALLIAQRTAEPPAVVIVRRYVYAPAPDPVRSAPSSTEARTGTTPRSAPARPADVAPKAAPKPRPAPARATSDAVTKGSG